MFGGLNRLLVAAAVAGVAVTVALAGPGAALACSGNTSAENVYKECIPNGGGNSTAKSPQGGNGGTGSNAISGPAARALKHAGKDRRALAFVEHTGPSTGLLRGNPASVAAAEPSAVGSAFDLGSGPGAFLIALAGGALLLLGGSGLRVWRHRRP